MKGSVRTRFLPALAVLLASVVSLSAGHASGAVLARYEFGTDVTSGPTAANVTASNFTTTYPAGNSARSSAGNFFVRVAETETTLNAAEYFSFTSTAATGYVLNLENVSFGSLMTHASQLPAGYTGTVYLRSSVDGFASNLVEYSQASTTDQGTFTTRGPVDLTGSQYQGLSSVEFRMYFTDSTDVSGASFNAVVHRVDNVLLNGTVVAVPEPGTWSLALLGSMALVLRRKRGLVS